MYTPSHVGDIVSRLCQYSFTHATETTSSSGLYASEQNEQNKYPERTNSRMQGSEDCNRLGASQFLGASSAMVNGGYGAIEWVATCVITHSLRNFH